MPLLPVDILIDGKSMCYRQYFAHKFMVHKGIPTGMYHGIGQSLAMLKTYYPRSRFIWCWDGKIDNLWRRKIDPLYKEHRKQDSEPKQVIRQHKNTIKDFVAALGIPWLYHKNLEADDILALYGDLSPNNVVMVTTDSDIYQCLADGPRWIKAHGRDAFTYSDLVKSYGKLVADNWVRFRALVGDVTDRLPGLYGCGASTATQLLQLGAKPERPWEAQPQPLRVSFEAKYRQHWPGAELTYRLSKLPRLNDLPMVDQIEEIIDDWPKISVVADHSKWLHYCDEMRLVEVRRRFQLIANQG